MDTGRRKRSELREVNALLEQLAGRGYGVILYSDNDKENKEYGGIERICNLAQLAAWLGSSQFELLSQDYKIKNHRDGRYFSVTAYLVNNLIKELLGQIASQPQISIAA